MEWISCNKCSLKLESDIPKFFLLTCGNILCEKCATKSRNTNKCSVCDKAVSFVELNKSLDYKMQMYFWPTENLFAHLSQILGFQNMQKKLFLKMLNGKYTFAKQQCLKLDSACRRLEKENKTFRDMLQKIGMKKDPFSTSTPIMRDFQQSGSKNASVLSSGRLTMPLNGPGSAQRLVSLDKNNSNTFRFHSSTTDPSPVQMVPRRYVVPVHRTPSSIQPQRTLSTPHITQRSQIKSNYPFGGYPKK